MPAIIYLTYNPKSRQEEATALRLQTIANLYGIEILLPDRLGVGQEANTQQRIKRADFIIAFALSTISTKVLNELKLGLAFDKNIIIVNDKKVGKTVNTDKHTNVIYANIDFQTGQTDQALHNITEFIHKKYFEKEIKNKKKVEEMEKGILAFSAVALGVLALATLASDEGK